MTGTKQGAKKALRITKQLYGRDFFKICGKKGGNPALLKDGKNV
jgi:hypothetical protein